MLHDEGRARYSPASGHFTYDYFVKDHLGNVRTMVSGNVTNGSGGSPVAVAASYVATHEVAAAGVEDVLFTNIDAVRRDKPEWTDPADIKAAALNAADPGKNSGHGHTAAGNGRG